MLRYHMAVITRDNALKREVKRVTTATGSTASFVRESKDIETGDDAKKIDLAIFDARKGKPDKTFFNKVPKSARIMYVLDGESLVQKITLLDDPRCTSLLCHDARFDEDEFISSATKALRGDVFGLQKYFPWGVTTFSMVVKNSKEKSKAIEIMMRYAQLAGVRGPVRDRIQLVCDELMMNALYHAPVDDQGKELYRDKSPKELAQLDHVSEIQVQYGCSGRYFGVSVRDGGGSLTRKRALEYLSRAKSGHHIESKTTGAGLGLVSVLNSVSKLIFNLSPDFSTEVIGLFDMELFAKGKVGARSLHVFTAAEQEADEDEYEEDETALATSGGQAKLWVFAAFLAGVLLAMSVAFAIK